jgi:hypothetical protein
MSGSVDFSKYSTVLFMDSMVALEGKPMHQLPWKEVDKAGPLLVLVLPQVMKEIDKRKRDGRLAKRAREFNRLIGPAAVAAAPAQIVAGPPAVDIAMAECERITWDAYDDLDPEEGDDRVVAQLLHAKGIPNDRKLLFSYDNNPIAIASRHGIKSRKMPDHWLLEAEPSPHDKELQKLKLRMETLEAQEPEFTIDVAFGVTTPLRLYRVRPLTEEEQEALSERIIGENPKAHYQRNQLMMHVYDSGYDARYEKYRKEIVPRHAAQLHRHLEVDYSQIPFRLSISNSGHIQAENLIVTVRATNGGLHSRFIAHPTFGPAAPQPKEESLIPMMHREFLHAPQLAGRHDMNFADGPDGSGMITIHCEDFRHGHEWSFEGIARVDLHSASPFLIQVVVTASNLHGSRSERFELPFEVQESDAKDLINLEGRGFIVDFPLMPQFKDAVEKQNMDWFEFPESDYGDD